MAYAEALAGAAGGRREMASAEAFRDAMRELASGVALVTTERDGRRSGCVVTSITSLSLTPPTLLVCLNRDSSTLDAIRAVGAFAVSILSGGQEALAMRFASSRVRGEDRFEGAAWRKLSTGAPTLADALAVFDCRLVRVVEHATHAILIGEAVEVGKSGEAPALLHWRSRFEQLA
jgi:flavin reductase (DIM6/NTAB) family NADH-FMN oxidoreductase RutF